MKYSLKTSYLMKILLVLSILLSVFGLAHWFMYLTVVRSLEATSLFRSSLVPIYIIGLISMPLGFLASRSTKNKFIWLTWFGYIWMGFFTIHFFFSVVEFAISYFSLHVYSYWVVIVAVIVAVWALYKGLKFPTVVTHKVSGPEQIKNFKVAQISDLHVGMLHLNTHWLERVVDQLNTQKPDIIAITGDLVEGDFNKISEALKPLQKLQSTCGVFYITGNHEYIHLGDWEECLRKLGITSLHNENRIITYNNEKILIAGVPDKMANRFNQQLHSSPDVALASSEIVLFKILLAHQPASILALKNETCDLMISGHTHGGQIFPFHFAVLLQQPMIKGFKKFGETLVFNHQGTGFWGPPMRWFSRSEIVILEINE